MQTYQTTNPRAVANPLRSLPLYTPAHRILGWHPLDKACAVLAQAEQAIPTHRARLDLAHAKLGRANRCSAAPYRRVLQADAMRAINMERAAMRNAHKALDAARADLARLIEQPELPVLVPAPCPTINPDLLPTVPRILREAIGSFPRGTICTVERSKLSGWYAKIVRPGQGGGVATHVEGRMAAWDWVDAELASAVLH